MTLKEINKSLEDLENMKKHHEKQIRVHQYHIREIEKTIEDFEKRKERTESLMNWTMKELVKD